MGDWFLERRPKAECLINETVMVNPSIPREKIPWFPSINYDLCKGAKECLAFCPHRVFERRDNGTRLVVANADIAQSMARNFGRKYEELHGTGELLTKLLLARQSTDEVLVVPPHHETAFDPLNKTLTAVPIWESENARGSGVQHLVFDDPGTGDQADRSGASAGRLGLGIDAGGTYTDVVIYDFQGHQVLQKAKALTTKWDFTIGIEQALDQLDRSSLTQVDLVSISTTLATNAIVEGRGQTAGLIIMPPYGLFDPPDILYRPIAILDAKMEIDGTGNQPRPTRSSAGRGEAPSRAGWGHRIRRDGLRQPRQPRPRTPGQSHHPTGNRPHRDLRP